MHVLLQRLILNKLGRRTATGQRWNEGRVESIRKRYELGEEKATSASNDVLSLGEAARFCQVSQCTIKKLVASGKPLFGICLGHQMLAIALGGKTMKMHQGHHGANHPVKDFTTNKVEIVSMNHGFAVDQKSLPAGVVETHVSLFDGSNCGIALEGKPVFSVQHHPEASPGPQDSHYLFKRFVGLMEA